MVSGSTALFVVVCTAACLIQTSNAQLATRYCPAPGQYYNPFDCATYFECDQGRDEPVLKKCAPGTFYNHLTTQCDWPRNVNCNRPITQAPVVLQNPYPFRTLPVRNTVSVPIGNPFVTGGLRITAENCQNIARALETTLRSQVSAYDQLCVNGCDNLLPRFNMVCN